MDDFVNSLRKLHVDCLRPSYRKLVKISGRLRQLYPDYDGDLTPLSIATLSAVLNGKRKRLPGPGLVASFVLSCQRAFWEATKTGDDPGPANLPGWFAALRAAHNADADAATGENAGSADPPARLCPPSAVRLTPAQRQRVESYGRYALTLIGELQAGDPAAVYRVALLLGTDPDHTDAARALLLHAAAAEHAAAFELLDSSRGWPSVTDMARHARSLADAAHASARSEEAQAYDECAARSGDTTATVRLAITRLGAHDEHEAAGWLASIAGLFGPRAR
jgi:hypothetical protein